jgi:hypothetical protein
MEVLLNVIAGLGLAASVALIGWGMALCARHGFEVGAARIER